MILDARQVVAHVLLLVVGHQEHNIVVNTHLLRLQVQHIDSASESCGDHSLLIVAEITRRDRCLAFLVNHGWLACISKVPNGDLAILAN